MKLLSLAIGVAAAASVVSAPAALAGPAPLGQATAVPAAAAGELCDLPAATSPVVGATDRGQRSLDSALAARGRTAAATGGVTASGNPPANAPHPFAGNFFKADPAITGTCATQRITSDFRPSNLSTRVFSPTMIAPRGCIEIVTVLDRGRHSVGAYDWCPTGSVVGFRAGVRIDDGFLRSYTDGAKSYTARTYQSDPATKTWVAELYNYSAKRWDLLFTSKGDNRTGSDLGWNIDEMWDTPWPGSRTNGCTDRKGLTFESSGISVRRDGRWRLATADDAYQTDKGWSCSTHSFSVLQPMSHWRSEG